MNNHISEFIQVFDKRIFFDIASSGCGSGCVYCFSKHPDEKQVLLPVELVDHICDEIVKLPECSEMIISLCPNTEPIKSEESRKLVRRIVERLAAKVKFIQISTKELIPTGFLAFLNESASYAGQVRISVSLPYLSDVESIEPNAASIYDRLKNFNNMKQYANLVSILYLRPFNRQMLINKDKYTALISEFHPDDICLGAEFVPKVEGEQFCTYVYNKQLARGIFENVEKTELFGFADFLRKETGCKVFFSSLCNIANCSDYGCMLKLHVYDRNYCLDCALRMPDAETGQI